MSEKEIIKVGITGLGSYVPETVVTNKDLERHVKTTDKWIRQRTGIRERRFASKEEPLPVMMAVAAQRALDDAGLSVRDIDYIRVGANGTDPYLLPHLAARVQYLIGAREISCSDSSAGCSGVTYAVEDIVRIIRDCKNTDNREVRGLVVGGDTLSHIVDVTKRESLVVLADGVGAAVVELIDDDSLGIKHMFNQADGSMGYLIYSKSGFACPLVEADPVRLEKMWTLPGEFMMAGRSVHRFILEKANSVVKELIEKSGFGLEVLADTIIVPHQMNKKSLDSWEERLIEEFGIAPRLLYMEGVEKYGNTSPASTLIALDELYRSGRLGKGDHVIVAAFGSGLTWGGFFINWNREMVEKPWEYDMDEQKELANEFYRKYQDWKAKLPVRKKASLEES